MKYDPLLFLSALGSGGISVAFWKLGESVGHNALITFAELFFLFLQYVLFVINLWYWLKEVRQQQVLFGLMRRHSQHPLTATGWMSMPAALAMVLNSSFAVLPTFFNVSITVLLPLGLLMWVLSAAITLILGFMILVNSFAAGNSLQQFHFGILFQPLVYGLNAIPGIAMSSYVTGVLKYMTLLGGLTLFSVGGVIGALAVIFLFLRLLEHGLPPQRTAPTVLLLLPSISVYTIFVLRLFHFINHTTPFFPPIIFTLVALTGFGIMLVSTLLGLLLLLLFVKEHIPFSSTWWSFVCPMVALSVLTTITFVFVKHPALLLLSVASLGVAVLLYVYNAFKTITTLLRS
jgi:tellurite resistance protein TehA-like permease